MLQEPCSTHEESFGIAGLGPGDVLKLEWPVRLPMLQPDGSCWLSIEGLDPERLLQVELWVGADRPLSIRSMTDGRGRLITAGSLLRGISCYSQRRGLSIECRAVDGAGPTRLCLGLDIRQGVPAPTLVIEA